MPKKVFAIFALDGFPGLIFHIFKRCMLAMYCIGNEEGSNHLRSKVKRSRLSGKFGTAQIGGGDALPKLLLTLFNS